MALGGRQGRVCTALPALCTILAIAASLGCEDDIDVTAQLNERLRELANPGPPPVDASNALIGNDAAIALGHKLYFDDDFSGYATEENVLHEVVDGVGRAERGQRIKVSCATCHDLDIGGVDPGGEFPNRVSFGAGAYDVNSQPTVNAAYNGLMYWNARNDSLWSQVLSVTENRVSMFGSRLRVAWRIADAYRDEYDAIFPDNPIPEVMDSITAQAARINPDGTCVLDEGACPEDTCHLWDASSDGIERCLPRFPLQGKPGFRIPGELWVCDFGTDDPLQPYGDAYDCMDLDDRTTIDRIYANYGKLIAAYEYTLIAVDSPFDRWVSADFDESMLSPAAQRGARLFVGKAACVNCHSGPMLTDDLPHNIGVPQAGDFVPDIEDCPEGAYCDCVSDDTSEPQFCFPKGARHGIRMLVENRWRRDGFFSDDRECASRRQQHQFGEQDPDECGGLAVFYPVPVDPRTEGAWRTPTLRNVELTGPYMHNGMWDSLETVMEHYNTAGAAFESERIGELDEDMVPLNLSEDEIADIIEFMLALTSEPLPAETRAVPDLPPPSPFPEITPF